MTAEQQAAARAAVAEKMESAEKDAAARMVEFHAATAEKRAAFNAKNSCK